jgi:hypothetical protein
MLINRSSAATCLVLIASLHSLTGSNSAQENDWISLFDGQNLDNWIPKFSGYPLGENLYNTFRAEDGVLQVSYDDWPGFNNEFGHLFYEQPYSHYRLRAEYRFVGAQVGGGEGWAYRNNGFMLHSQDPATMTLDQAFPVSIEAQLLGGNGSDARPTANVCSPGTHYQFDGELFTPHCKNSVSETYHGDQWVSIEIEVYGDELIRHYINGELVFEYAGIQLDPDDPDAQRLLDAGHGLMLDEGYIAIQAESHPTEFRNIQLLPLDH